jgi:hypothetical protein
MVEVLTAIVRWTAGESGESALAVPEAEEAVLLLPPPLHLLQPLLLALRIATMLVVELEVPGVVRPRLRS